MVTRVTTQFVLHNETDPLVTLEPKTPIQGMDFQVLTAYNNLTREFYVAGAVEPRQSKLWQINFDANVDNAAIVNQTVIKYPTNATTIARIHAAPNSVLVVEFSNGDVYTTNPANGQLSFLGNILVGSALEGGIVTQASAVDYDLNNVYTVVKTRDSKTAYIVTLSISTGNITTLPLILAKEIEHEAWEQETLFHALWIPLESQLLVFALGSDLGFDQVLWVAPFTGATTAWQANLAENNFWFQVQTSTKTDDTLQTGTYDYVNNLIYFQCTQNQGTDDDIADPTVIASLNLLHREYPPDVEVTFTFGYMGFAYVPVIN